VFLTWSTDQWRIDWDAGVLLMTELFPDRDATMEKGASEEAQIRLAEQVWSILR